MIDDQTEMASLPPILSPTLPSEWDSKFSRDSPISGPLELPSAPLSPSLPDAYLQSYMVSLKLPKKDGHKHEKAESRKLNGHTDEDAGHSSSGRDATNGKQNGNNSESDTHSSNNGSSKATPTIKSINISEATKKAARAISLKAAEGNASNGGASTPHTEAEPAQSTTTSPIKAVNTETATSPVKGATKTRAIDEKNIEAYRKARAHAHKWMQIARNKKHDADSATEERQHRMAAAISIDTIICFIIAFDFEDRAEILAARKLHARSWTSLIPYLRTTSSYLESVDADIGAVCSQVSAVVRLHISQVIRRSSEQESISAAAAAVADFRRGLTSLPPHVAAERYRLQSWTTTRLNPDFVDPVNDQAALPLHVLSTPQEAATFAFHVARRWVEEESIDYNWTCPAVLDS